MKTHDNTLYVTTQGAYLARQRDCLAVRAEKRLLRQFPIHVLDGVVCFGNVSCSPFLLGLCGEHGVTVSLLTENGRFLARVEGPESGNVLLRRAQYRASDDPAASAEIARASVAAKIANARTVLLRAARERDNPSVGLSHAAARLAESLGQLDRPAGLDTIRGIEGDAGRSYYAAFDNLIVAQKSDFRFTGRSRRPPMDRVNAMLSFLSVMLAHDARSACQAVGLDAQVGFLHRDRPGRDSLALDLMEELRPVLVDRMVLSMINRRQVTADGFDVTVSGAVEMAEKTRKGILNAWQKRKAEEITHPFLQEKITVGLIVHVQARLLARHLRGDLDAYPAFFWR